MQSLEALSEHLCYDCQALLLWKIILIVVVLSLNFDTFCH